MKKQRIPREQSAALLLQAYLFHFVELELKLRHNITTAPVLSLSFTFPFSSLNNQE